MFKKLLNKVMHSIEQSKSEHGHRGRSSSNRGKRGYTDHSRSDRSDRSHRHSSSDGRKVQRGSTSDGRHAGEHQGHKYYKNKHGNHSS
jgi:hypothetical protein